MCLPVQESVSVRAHSSIHTLQLCSKNTDAVMLMCAFVLFVLPNIRLNDPAFVPNPTLADQRVGLGFGLLCLQKHKNKNKACLFCNKHGYATECTAP